MKTTGEATGLGEAGLTLVEILMAMVLLSIVMGVGFQGFRNFNQSTNVDRAARTIASDVTLTRSYAVQRRSTVELDADEGARSYVIRDVPAGEVLKRRSFSASTDLPLTLLDVQTGDDSFAFNPRGLLAGASNVIIDLGRFDNEKRIRINAMGRTQVTTP